MKFLLPKDAAKKAISYILSIVAEPTILISTRGDGNIHFEGAGKSIYARVRLQAITDRAGVIAVDGQRLAKIQFPSDVLFDASDSTKLTLQSGSFYTEIEGVQSGGYVKRQRPVENESTTYVDLPKDAFVRAAKATVFESAISNIGSGIVLKLNDKLVMHTEDDTRASCYISDSGLPARDRVTALAAPKLFESLGKIPGEGFALAFPPGRIYVRTESCMISYPQLQSEFIDVEEFVLEAQNKPVSTRFTVSSKVLKDGIVSMTSALSDKIDYDIGIKFSVNPETSHLDLEIAGQHGNVRNSIVLDGQVLSALPFTLSGKYLIEILPLLVGDVVLSVFAGEGGHKNVIFSSDEGRSTVILRTMIQNINS